MGKVTDMVTKIRAMKAYEIYDRFLHLARAQAVREYMAAKVDTTLVMEIRLLGEEITRRMSTYVPVTPEVKIKKNKTK